MTTLSATGRSVLPGSAPAPCGDRLAGRADPALSVDVSLYLRARPDSRGLGWANRESVLPPSARRLLSRAEHTAQHGAFEDDVESITAFGARMDLACVSTSAAARRVVLRGPVAAMERAFEVVLHVHQAAAGGSHLGRGGPVWMPRHCVTVSRAVLGLEGCLGARSLVEMTPRSAMGPQRDGMTRTDVARVLGLGGTGDGVDVDVALVTAAPHGGASGGAAALEAAVALAAPGARVRRYVTGRGERSVVDAVVDAVVDPAGVAVLLLDCGAAEGRWSRQALRTLGQVLLGASAMGVTVVAGSPQAAWFPATSPHATACAVDTVGARSPALPAPVWQPATSAGDGVVGRAVPDLVLDVAGGIGVSDGATDLLAGGPAIAAALVCGGVATIVAALGVPLGCINAALWSGVPERSVAGSTPAAEGPLAAVVRAVSDAPQAGSEPLRRVLPGRLQGRPQRPA